MRDVLRWGALVVCGCLGFFSRVSAVSVLTYHNDNFRTGANTNETILTPANVNSGTFGKMFNCPVDGQVYAQPLILENVTIPGKGVHNVLFIVTEHDSVYAYDADDNVGSNSVPLWQVSFIDPVSGITTVPIADVNCQNNTPEIGITSTPVIDPDSGTIYVVAKTKEVTGLSVNYYQRLHALDVSTGAEKFGGPATINASVPGTGDDSDGQGSVLFEPLHQFNRAALLLSRGVVYIGFASHCDITPFHGWLIGYAAQTLTLVNAFNTTPNSYFGGIWQAGCGPAVDDEGNIYVVTANGPFSPELQNYSDSVLKLSPSAGLVVADYFTPYDEAVLDAQDGDLGSAGQLLLPDSAGSAAHPHLMVAAGKEGTIYLIDRDNMGHFNPTNDSQIPQVLVRATYGAYDTPAYFNYNIYYDTLSSGVRAYAISNGMIATPPQISPDASDGATPCVSANGTSNALVWIIQADNYFSGPNGPAALVCFNATNVTQELYNSSRISPRDDPGPAIKFCVPTIANGKVYVQTQNGVAVYGTNNFLAVPTISPAAGVFEDSVVVTLVESTPGAEIYYTLDDTIPTTNSRRYTGPFTLGKSTGVEARAFMAGAVDSAVVAAAYIKSSSIGLGTGLTGDYYADTDQQFIDPPTLTRIDPVIDFDWSDVGPDPSIGESHFTVRWTGGILPQFDGEYTFQAYVCDGVRLWINDQLIIDQWWRDILPTEYSATVPLYSGQQCSIKMEYFQTLPGSPAMRLSWSTPSFFKTDIPQSQLFPVFTEMPPSLSIAPANPPTNGSFQLQMLGYPGKTYVLQAATNLFDWISVSTNIATASLSVLTDPNATNFSSRFYRVVKQP